MLKYGEVTCTIIKNSGSDIEFIVRVGDTVKFLRLFTKSLIFRICVKWSTNLWDGSHPLDEQRESTEEALGCACLCAASGLSSGY